MYISKRAITIILALFVLIIVLLSINRAIVLNRGMDSLYAQIRNFTKNHWGSFTDSPITSSDGRYTASYSSTWLDEYKEIMIIVDIRDAESGKLVSAFIPAPSEDFYGICWEDGTHNIWVQSASTGIQCYARDGERWILDADAILPDSIIPE